MPLAPPNGSRADSAHDDHVFERHVFQNNGEGTTSFGGIDLYERNAFILEAKRGGDADRAPAEHGQDARGLATLIRQHHDAIDAATAGAYGWGDQHRVGTLETISTK